MKFYPLARQPRERARAESHRALFRPGVHPFARSKEKERGKETDGGEEGKRGKKWCSRRNGSSERDTNGVARVRSLKPSRGNAKHVTVLKESREIGATDVCKACPYAVKRTLTYHRIFYFVIP